MSTEIKSLKELEQKLNSKISLAMEFTQEEIFQTIQRNIEKYYAEKVFFNRWSSKPTNIPKLYERTSQFLNSLFKTNISVVNGKLSCAVGIDLDSLEYNQDAKTVIDMINRGFHADTLLNEDENIYDTPYDIHAHGHFWDDSIEELGGYEGILKLFKNNCKKVGLPIE